MSQTPPRWIVLKFGGTSVSSLASWETIAAVVRKRLEEGVRPVVVHSALGGVTDLLGVLPARALEHTHLALLAEMGERHDRLAAELGIPSEEIGRASCRERV